MPSFTHEVPVASQRSLTVAILWRLRNDCACFRSACVPRPMTLISFAFCRANCSTPGAARLHSVQFGAQNQTSSGFEPVNAEASAYGFPLRTSVTVIAGNGFTAFAAVRGYAGNDEARRTAEAEPAPTALANAAATDTTPMAALVNRRSRGWWGWGDIRLPYS